MIAFVFTLIAVGLVVAHGWLLYEISAAPNLPDPGARPLTVDEQVQAATAAAVLQPDAPLFTAADEAAIDEAAHAADVDAFLGALFPTVRPASPEEF